MALKFRKKPVVVEAMCWDGSFESAVAIMEWSGGSLNYREYDDGEDDTTHLAVHTLEGVMRAEVGDFVIRGVQGEFYPCKPDIFAATYDEVA